MARPPVDKPKGTSRNEHTGKFMRTGTPSDKYKDNYDQIDWSHVREKKKEPRVP